MAYQRRYEKAKSEFDQKVLDIRRVARVVAGGKRFRFRATVTIGDRKGRVGVGVAKGQDVTQAVEKAVADAKKHLIRVSLEGGSIPHEVEAKYSAARVILKRARAGRGIIAGGAVRAVLELAGIGHVTAKVLGTTKNHLSNARATIEALKKLKATSSKLKADAISPVTTESPA
ncbi:30S ribosomal protein S5 [Candidatus Azambacteria bacterium]|nr:30S ribosomal protein S5 [Candidatus Azambacteria bacterium]MBI2587772.1 30S ribosomal protein S5 [Candidatus Azambacteria bacterium]